uniref:Cadherin domain-containing protein n=1 Tax=Glossina morsitans morsitans TaxID=37546 RepID=A0A1B0FB48_GLOMM
MWHSMRNLVQILQQLFLILCLMLYAAYNAKSQHINQLPHFIEGGDMAHFSLAENVAIGSPVYQLKGVDPKGSAVKYSISGPVFSVDRHTGVVRLRQELDRETQDTIEVIISLTDEGLYGNEPHTISLRREIPVRDYNDNQPIFMTRPYLANISESLEVNSELDIKPPIIVLDHDTGRNAEVTIKCVQENDICDTFNVTAEEISPGNYTAHVFLRKPLDFERRPNYIMTISASDGSLENPLTSYATISISLIDVQDQSPVFINAPYSATIDENTAPGVSVLNIAAIDGDVGIPRDVILSLEDEVFGYFTLIPFGDPVEGTAILSTTNISLDRENPRILQNAGVYVFAVRATELIDGFMPADSSTTQITIVVNDIDDHVPMFNSNNFTISIPENLGMGMPLPGLAIFINDLDTGSNSHYDLKLRNIRNSLNVFSVSPVEGQGRTPIVIKVLNSTRLDYDVADSMDRIFLFDIIASVRGEEKSKVRVNVELTDLNDNSPVFELSSYRFSVSENLPPNSRIGSITATEKDSGKFGDITYCLKGFGADYFYTDPKLGGFFIKKSLDYETQSSYSFSIVATDGGGRETNAQIYVEIDDINDNYPQFEKSEYVRTIRENTAIFEPQFIIRAIDVDGPTQGGGKIRYAIVSENSISGNVFHIDEVSGEISLQKIARSKDTERGEYELEVAATDFGIPPLTNITKVSIRVGISGNQRPVFKGHFQNVENVPILGPPSYRVSIPENAPAGHNVTVVRAYDPDGLDSLLRYRIVGANDNFEIDEAIGLIRVSPQARIDRESNMGSFEIIVNAVDSGLPIAETATSTVYVNIKDINDEKPKFEHPSYVAYISERTEFGETVTKVKAIDSDLNSKLCYSIKDDNIKAITKTGVSLINRTNYRVEDAFRINNQSGIISVNGKLRHDLAAVIVLPIEVRDLNAEINPNSQIDTTEVTIYVQSFKDTNPVFTNKGWVSSKAVINIHIMEEMPIESTLFVLQAEDPITKQPIKSFQLIEPLKLEYFHIHERSGEVILRKRLDYETLRDDEVQCVFQIKANSPDGQRSTISKVNITIENVNDNGPIFEEQSYRATVEENKKHPLKIIRVRATDKDATLTERDERFGYHKIIYSLHGEHSGLFEINSLTGEIMIGLNQVIDHERTPRIYLQVKAEDSPGKPMDSKQSFAELEIDVLDINDNVPQFSQIEYTAVIPENAEIETSVIKVFASDLDEGPSGEVYYKIVEEDEVTDLFKINKYTGEIKTKSELTGKGRAEPYTIRIIAQDNGEQVSKQMALSSETSVAIYIGDVSANDGKPYFLKPKDGQVADVKENAPVGTAVFQVQASDPDNPNTPSGTLHYKILDDTFDAAAFKIDENTGLISTSQVLDRETKDLYNIILEVYDDGQPGQSLTKVLQINILDVNDHQPVFCREPDEGPLQFLVLEEEDGGTIVGNFAAIDIDIGENALIDYVIIEGNDEKVFSIETSENNTATLKTTKPIDRELVEHFQLTVKCLQRGEAIDSLIGDTYDRYDRSHLRIHVRVIDIDDNLPQFEHKYVSVGVRINVPIDTIITKIRVTDLDAEAEPLILTIENLTFVPQFYKRTKAMRTAVWQTLFVLDNRTGELKTAGSFADYVDGYFEMKIRANNSQNVKRHTFSTFKVFIIRDKSLLKFVFARPPKEIRNIVRPFQEKMREKLTPFNLNLHIMDTQALTRSDYSLDFTAASSCFQMFRNGSAMALNEMKRLMNSERLKEELLDVYVEYGISAVEPCSTRKMPAIAGIIGFPGIWLVGIAALIGMAALITVCTACFLRKKFKAHSNHSLQTSYAPTESFGVSVPAVYLPYSEPMYGPL